MRGHPYVLAQPYRTGRYLLIGPSVLPQYWHALRTALAIAFFAVVVLAGVLAVGGAAPVDLARYLGAFFRLAFYIVLCVTLAFAVIDVVQGRLLEAALGSARAVRAHGRASPIGRWQPG